MYCWPDALRLILLWESLDINGFHRCRRLHSSPLYLSISQVFLPRPCLRILYPIPHRTICYPRHCQVAVAAASHPRQSKSLPHSAQSTPCRHLPSISVAIHQLSSNSAPKLYISTSASRHFCRSFLGTCVSLKSLASSTGGDQRYAPKPRN